jgi:hypothetical protein
MRTKVLDFIRFGIEAVNKTLDYTLTSPHIYLIY